MCDKEKELYRKILWFDNRFRYKIDFFDLLQPQRKVSGHRRYKSGMFYSGKCSRWIQYESGIEYQFIQQLEQMNNVLFYYEQPVQIQYWRGRRKLTYTPDFGLYFDTGEFVLVEIKDLPHMLADKVQLKVEALLDFCSRKGFGLLFFDGKNTFEKLLKTRNNPRLEKAIMNRLDNGPIGKKEYNEIAEQSSATYNQLFKVIIRNNLSFMPFPFKIMPGNRNAMFRSVFVEKRRYDDLAEEKFHALFK